MNRSVKYIFTFLIIFFFSFNSSVFADDLPENVLLGPNDVEIEMTDVIVKGIETKVKFHFKNPEFRKIYEGYPITIQELMIKKLFQD